LVFSVSGLKNWTGQFFKNSNRFNRFFFHGSVFLVIFFSGFLGLIGFLVFCSPLVLLIVLLIIT
jgi:hypothetical protein